MPLRQKFAAAVMKNMRGGRGKAWKPPRAARPDTHWVDARNAIQRFSRLADPC